MSEAPSKVRDLVERFNRNRATYKSPSYNETQVRREFIDPLFKSLGWDVDNEQGFAEAYKDVIHEDAIKVGGATKAPDYCFRIGGARKFFLEAKRPAIPLRDSAEPAYQLRRYAWSAKLPLSILTDFEELAVYDCRVRPHKNDKPTKARTMYFTYDQYAERWEELASVFSRDAVLKGSFDKYAESARRKKGTAEVDVEFLKEIERWRDLLAANFALRNKRLSVRDLNFAVQRTIDRVIFLRMCEDRGIEPYGQLLSLCATRTEPQASARGQDAGPVAHAPGSDRGRLYQRLGEIFRRADERYNSSLFYFTPEKGREPPDELTLGLKLDDKLLKDILGGLYYPESPYEFAVLPPEILGQVYEQFLGKVIRLTTAHRAKVEEKPEVRKAGGVYYTPAYIVDYIVKHTVGKLLEGKTPADVGPDRDQSPKRKRGVEQSPKRERGVDQSPTRERGVASAARRARRGPVAHAPGSVRPLRILDPACGSGSFLLGAYQYLLDWHRDWYVRQAEGAGNGEQGTGRGKKPSAARNAYRDRIYQAAGGQWRLTVQEKKRILLNNIFGVDIDPQAVEVTKLSLLLKVLEGETAETIGSTLRLFHERALPDLSDNVKCGNSLIGPDFYEGKQLSMFDEEERLRINAFDWQAEFPDVFRQSPERQRRVNDQSPTRERGVGQSPKRKRGVEANAAASGRRPLPHGRGSVRGPVAHAQGSDPDSGFDAVIGNPPYIRMEVFKELKDYLRQKYFVHDERTDLYVYFIEREHELLRDGGRFGMIVSNKFLRANYGRKVRELLSRTATVQRIVDLAGLPVFRGATVRTIVLITSKCAGDSPLYYSPPPDRSVFNSLEAGTYALGNIAEPVAYSIPQAALAAGGWRLNRPERAALLNETAGRAGTLSETVGGRICRGIVSGLNDAFVISGKTRAKILADNPKAASIIRPFLQGRHIRRYRLEPPDEYLIYTYHGIDMSAYPAVIEHLRPFKKRLGARATQQAWYELQQPQFAYKEFLESAKIVFPDIATECRFALDTTGHFGANTVYFIPRDDLFLLALLNSRLGHFYFVETCAALEGPGEAYLRFFGQYLEGFPVCKTPGERQRDDVLSFVQQMLDLHKQLSAAKTPHEQAALRRQIDTRDRQIDKLVYELYELTDDDIRLIEETTARS